MFAARLSSQAPIASAPLVVAEVPRPTLQPNRVRLRLHACGVCHTDLHIIEGDLPLHKTPIIPGHQAVGLVEAIGEGVSRVNVGDRVGVPWLHTHCGLCEFCQRGEENLCDNPTFTGWDVDGGFAEYMLAHETALVPIPAAFADEQAAPLLCAGIIGYRSLRCADLAPGEHVGLFGFGASAHLAIQLARHWGCTVSVFTRNAEHGNLAESLGAGWWGRAEESPPRPLDRAVIFAPSGALVPLALKHLRKGGTLAINAIHMSPIPEFDYNLLCGERTMRSVTNATHHDADDFMQLAAQIPVRTEITAFPLMQANEALLKVKQGNINGAAVLITNNQ